MTTSFSGSVLKLLRGSVAGQAIAFLALPILARIYNPQDFGVAQAMISILTIVLILSSLRMEVALLAVPESQFESTLGTAWWLCIATSTMVLLIAVALVSIRNDWPAQQRVLVMLVPVVSLFAGWNQLLTYVSLRRQAFGVTSNVKIVQSATYTSAAIALGNLRPSSATLLLSEALGRGAATAFMARTLGLTRRQIARPTLSVFRANLTTHRELVTIGLAAALVNAVGSTFTSIVLLWLFSASNAGQFAMVERSIGMPIALIVGTLSQVFMARLSASISTNNAATSLHTFHRLLGIQAMTGVPIFLLLFVAGPKILVFALGPDWADIGDFVRALIPLYLCSYVVGPVNMTLTMIGRQRLQLFWDCLRLAAVGVMWLTVWYFEVGIQSALWVYSGVSAACYVSYLFMAEAALRQLVTAQRSQPT